jgi:hypothetical protein
MAEIEEQAEGLDPETVTPPEKRGRGRPRADGDKVKGVKQSSKKPEPLAVDSLAQKIQIGHLLLANLLKADYFTVTENESKSLAKSIIEVLNRYQVEYNSDFMLWVNFATALGIIYIPRIKKYNDSFKKVK